MTTNKLIRWCFILLFGLMAATTFADFSDNHNDGVLNGWTIQGTRPWSEYGGMAVPGNANPNQGFLINNNAVTDNGELEVTYTADQWNGNRGGIVFRWTSTSSYYYVAVLPGNQWSNGITFCENSMDLATGTVVASNFPMNTTFTLKVEVDGSTFRFFIDGVLRGQITDNSHSSGQVGYGYSADWNTYTRYNNISWVDAEPETFELTTATDGSGTVAPASGTFPNGEVVALTATPASGWQFDHWSGDAAGTTNPLDVTMDADKNITAHFIEITYDLTTAVDGQGTVTPASGTYPEGTTVELTATPATGWLFDHWSGDASGSDNPVTVTMDSDKNVTAHFVAIPTYDLTTATDGEGTVAPASGNYLEGTDVEITATPATGWLFDHWSGDASGSDNPITVTMDSDKNITAHFVAIPTYDLTTATEGEGIVAPESGNYYEGTDVEITATPATGWRFDHWEGDVSGSDNPITVTMDSDKNLVAFFVEIPTFDLAVTVDGPGSVSPEAGTFLEGTDVEITATADENYMFDHWSGDASGSENPLTVTMGADMNITAHFVPYVPPIPNREKLSITAKLFDVDGNPVGSDDAVTLNATVRLYTDETAGLLRYTETFLQTDGQGVTVEQGRFIVKLRDGTSSDDLKLVLEENPHLWVEISIDGEPLERVPLTGAAYLITDAD